MIKVFLENVKDCILPSGDAINIENIVDAKRKLKKFEKKYHAKSHHVCRRINDSYILYDNRCFFYILEEDKNTWIRCYESYVRSSLIYKILVIFYTLNNKLSRIINVAS